MFASITYNLKNLTNIHGRDGRKVFWLYVLFIVILNVLASIVASIPMMVAAAEVGIAAAQSGNQAAAEAAILDEVINYAPTLVWFSIIQSAVNIVLLAASFMRRTHDVGLPGILVAVPIAIQVIWMFIAYRQLDGIADTMRSGAEAELAGNSMPLEPGMIAQDLLGWLAFLIVVLVGLMKSQQGPNAYGEGPKVL